MIVPYLLLYTVLWYVPEGLVVEVLYSYNCMNSTNLVLSRTWIAAVLSTSITRGNSRGCCHHTSVCHVCARQLPTCKTRNYYEYCSRILRVRHRRQWHLSVHGVGTRLPVTNGRRSQADSPPRPVRASSRPVCCGLLSYLPRRMLACLSREAGARTCGAAMHKCP